MENNHSYVVGVDLYCLHLAVQKKVTKNTGAAYADDYKQMIIVL